MLKNLILFSKCLQKSRPQMVREYRQYNRGCIYAVCPACCLTMEGEYVAYCVHCGQRLNWQEYARLHKEEDAVFGI